MSHLFSGGVIYTCWCDWNLFFRLFPALKILKLLKENATKEYTEGCDLIRTIFDLVLLQSYSVSILTMFNRIYVVFFVCYARIIFLIASLTFIIFSNECRKFRKSQKYRIQCWSTTDRYWPIHSKIMRHSVPCCKQIVTICRNICRWKFICEKWFD